MAIHTNLYLLVFLPLVMLIYQLVPRNKRWGVLLSASYVLYFSFGCRHFSQCNEFLKTHGETPVDWQL